MLFMSVEIDSATFTSFEWWNFKDLKNVAIFLNDNIDNDDDDNNNDDDNILSIFFISGFDGQSLYLQLFTSNFFFKFLSIKVQLFRGYDFKVQLFHTCTVLKNIES